MNKRGESSNEGGIGFCGLLTLVFIVLKLLGKISWSWIWVLSPMWIVLAVALILILVGVIIGAMNR